MSASVVITLGLLMALPAYALNRASTWVDLRLIAGWLTMLSVFAFFVYRSDKRRAETGAWRVPEVTLHLIAITGGWPGAFLGQRVYRHKTSKVSFQTIFWLVVLIHQFAAFDSLLDWRLTKEATRIVQAQAWGR